MKIFISILFLNLYLKIKGYNIIIRIVFFILEILTKKILFLFDFLFIKKNLYLLNLFFFYLIYSNKIFSNIVNIIIIIFVSKFREIYIKYKILRDPRLLKIDYIIK